MVTGSYISIITLNVSGLNDTAKDTDWLSGYKNKTLLYSIYMKATSDLGKHTDWKWGSGRRYTMEMEI